MHRVRDRHRDSGIEQSVDRPVGTGRALRFLVHFVGDVHQPLHADDGDRGGNDKIVIVMNPRAICAGKQDQAPRVVGSARRSGAKAEPSRSLATALEQKLTDAQQKVWSTGTAADWAWESYNLAREAIYGEFAPGRLAPTALPYRGIMLRRRCEIVDAQLEKAGVRLAWVLNGLFNRSGVMRTPRCGFFPAGLLGFAAARRVPRP